MLVHLPSGQSLHFAPGQQVALGRGTQPELSAHPSVSRRQLTLEAVDGGLVVHATALTPLVLELPAAGGVPRSLAVIEPGGCAKVPPGGRFYVPSLEAETACSVHEAAGRGGRQPPDLAQAGNQDGCEGSGGSAPEQAPKRARTHAGPAVSGSGSASHGGDAQAQQPPQLLSTGPPPPPQQQQQQQQQQEQHFDARGRRLDPPIQLMHTQGIPEHFNIPPLNAKLHELVVGSPQLAFVCSYLLDFPWLLSELPALERAAKLLVVHAEAQQAAAIAGHAAAHGFGTRFAQFTPRTPPFGVHHSKAFLLTYEGTGVREAGVRAVIVTGNLLFGDTHCKTEALWTQDFPRKAPDSPPTSSFEDDLADYLTALGLPAAEHDALQKLCRDHDWSSARVHLVPSVPSFGGGHEGERLFRYGHMKVRRLLAEEPLDPEFRSAPVVMQCSSLGALKGTWVMQELLSSFTAGSWPGGRKQGLDAWLSGRGGGGGGGGGDGGRGSTSGSGGGGSGDASCSHGSRHGAARSSSAPPAPGPTQGIAVHFVWPTVQEVRDSLEGWLAGSSIPGRQENVQQLVGHRAQGLELCRWGGQTVGRQRAMPHIKLYCRFAGDRLPWLLVSSHNVSKAAWGSLNKAGTKLHVRHFELGVLATPVREAAYRQHRHCGFCVMHGAEGADGAAASAATAVAAAAAAQPPPATVSFRAWSRAAAGAEAAHDGGEAAVLVALPVPFALPPEPYSRAGAGDEPWAVDVGGSGVDALGRQFGQPLGNM